MRMTRIAVGARLEAGLTIRETAAELGCSSGTVAHWARDLRADGLLGRPWRRSGRAPLPPSIDARTAVRFDARERFEAKTVELLLIEIEAEDDPLEVLIATGFAERCLGGETRIRERWPELAEAFDTFEGDETALVRKLGLPSV